MTDHVLGSEMKSVAGWSSSLSSSGAVPTALRISGPEDRGADRDAETDAESDERTPCERQATLDDGDADAGERAELGADHHRPDDQDQRVGEDPHGGDQRRDDHERDEGARELADSEVRSSTSSHTTASAGAPRAISVALFAS